MRSFLNFSSLFLVIALLGAQAAFAQPANDDCADAIALSVGTECIFDDYTCVDATANDDATTPDPVCGFYSGADVWFTTTFPASGKLVVELERQGAGIALALYTGTCGNLSLFECAVGGSANTSFTGKLNYNDPTLAGLEIYVRVFARNNSAGTNFGICAYEPTTPSNDNCADAIALAVGTECVFQDFTTVEATENDDDGTPNPVCGFYEGADVWFTTTFPTSGKLVVELERQGAGIAFALYTGSCGNFTLLDCAADGSDNTSFTGKLNYNDPSLSGTAVYVRVFPRASPNGTDFGICAYEPVIPSNDNCADAIAIGVGTECVFESYTTLEATENDDSTTPNPGCGFYGGADVWFTTTFPASGKFVVELEKQDENIALALYTGSCGNLTLLDCADADSPLTSFTGRLNFNDISLGGLDVHVRVFRRSSSNGTDFGICAYEPIIPDNDHCADAFPLVVGQTCSFADYTNLEATENDDESTPSPGCGFYNGGDVWFTLEIPASGHLVVDTEQQGKRMGAALYQGSCGSLTVYSCIDNGSEAAGISAKIVVHDEAVAGETMYLRVFSRNDVNGSSFGLCAWEPNIPDNDFCADAFTVAASDCQFSFFDNKNCTEENELPNAGCGFFNGGDVWFKSTLDVNGVASVETFNAGEGYRPALEVYTGTCENFTSIGCSDGGSILSTAGLVDINDPSLANEEVLIRVFTRNNLNGGDFGLRFSTPGSVSCPLDVNGDNLLNILDLLEIVTELGCTFGCTADVNCDVKVDTNDLLFLVSALCVPCD